jgi:beta-mannosidase
MYNDNWGETGWTPIDYYLRRKPSYYWIRNANTPVRTIVRRRGGRLVTRVVNDTLKEWKLVVRCGWMRIDGSDARMKSRTVRLGANRMVEVGREPIPGRRALDPREWIYAAHAKGGPAASSPSVWLLTPYRELAVPEPDIRVTAKGKTLRLVSKTYCHGVHVADEGRGLLADNYFDLLPGVAKPVLCLRATPPGRIRFRTV